MKETIYSFRHVKIQKHISLNIILVDFTSTNSLFFKKNFSN